MGAFTIEPEPRKIHYRHTSRAKTQRVIHAYALATRTDLHGTTSLTAIKRYFDRFFSFDEISHYPSGKETATHGISLPSLMKKK